MDKPYLNYAENLKFYKKLDNVRFSPSQSKEYVLSQLKDIALKKRKIFEENNEIISEYIVPLEKKTEPLSEEEFRILNEFSESLALNFGSLDNAIYFRIHKILMNDAQRKQDLNLIVKETYYCGYCEYLFKHMDYNHRQLKYFPSIEKYIDSFDSLSEEGKMFFLRSYGNQLLDGTFDYERDCRVLNFVKAKKEQFPSEKIPYDRYILSIYRNISNGLVYFRRMAKTPEKIPQEYVDLVYEAAVYALEHIQENQSTSLPNLILIKYTLAAASFHKGLISLEELLDRFDELSEPDSNCSLAEKASAIVKMILYYIEYYRLYADCSKEEMINLLAGRTRKVLNFIRSIPPTEITNTLEQDIIEYLKAISNIYPFELCKDLLYQVTIVRHPSTFIHVDMVRQISLVLTKALLEHQPEFFEGILSGYSVEQVRLKKREILKTIEDMAMFHDVGKHFFINYINLAYRKLDDIEFKIIQLHSQRGYDFLASGKYPKPIADGILLHHLWHDGTKGYPEGAHHTNNLPLVDILSVADSIDAATDFVGRPYSLTKNLYQLKEEFEQFEGTRYAKEVVEILKRPEIFEEVNRIITEGREEEAYRIWTDQENY